jgi:hypothetical protein
VKRATPSVSFGDPKPMSKTLEAARRHGTLGATGARLLDIVREARAELKRIARHLR